MMSQTLSTLKIIFNKFRHERHVQLRDRRLVVNAPKAAQNDQAYVAPNEARNELNTKLEQMSPSDRALTQELVARITAAITPYFK